jgi:hypothetical protein
MQTPRSGRGGSRYQRDECDREAGCLALVARRNTYRLLLCTLFLLERGGIGAGSGLRNKADDTPMVLQAVRSSSDAIPRIVGACRRRTQERVTARHRRKSRDVPTGAQICVVCTTETQENRGHLELQSVSQPMIKLMWRKFLTRCHRRAFSGLSVGQTKRKTRAFKIEAKLTVH